MKSDLEDLKITERELERLTGCDVSSLFIGGVFGGVYRLSALQNLKGLITFCLTQVIVFLLVLVFSLPIGLSTLRNVTTGVNQISGMVQFLSLTGGIAIAVMLLWNLYMWLRGKRFRRLMSLLDEVDRYHQVLGAIAVLDHLEAVENNRPASNLPSQAQEDLTATALDDSATPDRPILQNRPAALEALRVTRDSLVAGLMTEKILRENHGLLLRRQELIASIETNLATLKTLEVRYQANEYGQILNEALQIGITVHREVHRLGA
jgi:hypothetical protein